MASNLACDSSSPATTSPNPRPPRERRLALLLARGVEIIEQVQHLEGHERMGSRVLVGLLVHPFQHGAGGELALAHGRRHRPRPADAIAPGEYPGLAGHENGIDPDKAAGLDRDIGRAAQQRKIGVLAHRQDDQIGREAFRLASRGDDAGGVQGEFFDDDALRAELLDRAHPSDLGAFGESRLAFLGMSRHMGRDPCDRR